MAGINAINLNATRNADGYALAGGVTERSLTLSGGNVSIVGGGAAVITFPTSTSTLATLALTETLSNKSFSTAPLPTPTDGAALGSASFQWSDLFLAEGAVINFDNGDLTLTQSGNNLAVGGGGHLTFGGADGSAIVDIAGATDSVQGLRIEGDATDALSFSTYITGDGFLRFNFLATGQMTWGSGSGAGDTNLYRQGANVLMTDDEFRVAVAGTNAASAVNNAGTQTLTNKRITPRVLSAASYTTDTGTSINGDTQDMFIVTAQAGALLFNNPTGTPTDGQKLIISVASSAASARALTWGAGYGATTVALPTTTAASTATLTIGFIYSTSKTLWQCVGVA